MKIPGMWFVMIGMAVCTLPVVAQQGKEGGTESKTKDAVSFKDDVLPIISKRCLPCHAEENYNPSDLSLDSYDKLMAGGEHGASVVPGKAQESILVKKLSATPPFGDPMPRERKKKKDDPWTKQLSPEEIKLISDWIDQGAKNN
jgi:hypothetical protein